MRPERILVTSAGGKTGLPLCLDLLARGFRVRALMRRDDHRARRLVEAGAETVVGDQLDPATLRRAMRDVQRAYHCPPTGPDGLYFTSVFAVAAAEARLEHVVSQAQWLSAPDHRSLYTREIWLGLRLLERLPDTTLTINAAGWFADNELMVAEPAAQLGILPLPFGDGDRRLDAPPTSEDIAAVSAAALAEPEHHAGRTYRPTGPVLLSPDEIARHWSTVLGRRVRYRPVSEAMFLKALAALRPPGYSPAMLTQLLHYVREYRNGTFAVGGPTDVVLRVAGRAPESYDALLRRRLPAMPVAVRRPGRRLRAMANFARILMTPTPDAERIEAARGHVLPAGLRYAQESAAWRAEHGLPVTGFGVADGDAARGATVAAPRPVP